MARADCTGRSSNESIEKSLSRGLRARFIVFFRRVRLLNLGHVSSEGKEFLGAESLQEDRVQTSVDQVGI